MVRNGLTVAAENHGHRIRPGTAMLTARVPAGRQPGRRQSGRTAASGWARPPRRSGPAAWAPLHVDVDHPHLPGEVTGGRSSAGSTRRQGAHHGDHITRVRRRGAPGDRDEAVVVGVDDLGQGLGAVAVARESGHGRREPAAAAALLARDQTCWHGLPRASRLPRQGASPPTRTGFPAGKAFASSIRSVLAPLCAEVAVTRAATADKLLVLVKRAQAEPYRLGGR